MNDQVHVPRLYPDLKLALASLYSIPDRDNNRHDVQRPTSDQAHEFLMEIQSRNIRRKILSIQQKHRDQQQNGGSSVISYDDSNDPTSSGSLIPMGSTWLACLAILCCPSSSHSQFGRRDNGICVATSTERIFAIQTLLLRLRRAKMIEGIDLEIEKSHDSDIPSCLLLYQSNQYVHTMISSYKEWMMTLNPFVGSVLNSYQFPSSIQTAEDEERVKGELAVLTFASISYYLVVTTNSDNKNESGPLISTCMSALVTTLIRLRFTPTSISYENGASPNTLPLVQTVQTVFDLVWQTALASQQILPLNHEALVSVLNTCLGCIPDAVMGVPGGARSRLSVDPRCLQAAIHELRTVDINLLSELFLRQSDGCSDKDRSMLDHVMIKTCTKWASFLPLTPTLLELAISRVYEFLPCNEHEKQTVALEFIITLYDSASWTEDQILALHVGFTSPQQAASQQQSGKKKQSSKSKKRQKEIVDQTVTDIHISQAKSEIKLRGEIACQASIMVWDRLCEMIEQELARQQHQLGLQVHGEGPIGCLSGCATACLPHLIRYPLFPNGRELFEKITHTFFGICGSLNKTVRALSYEPLYTLHGAIVDVGTVDHSLNPIVVDFFFKCSMSLASVCGYPTGYFDHPDAPSDEELEIERNDVRDLLRTVTGSGDSGSDATAASSQKPIDVCLHILSRIVLACGEAVSSAREQQQLFPETAAHAFSSLAKSLNHAAKFYCKFEHPPDDLKQILGRALSTILDASNIVINAFHEAAPIQEIFPIARVLNIAIASMSPMLSYISHRNSDLLDGMSHVLPSVIHVAILSIEHIPELCAPSILDHSIYDIRGAMRGPGGDDHVGCLTLLRITTESDFLVQQVVCSVGPFIERLCKLLSELKGVEQDRGKGIVYGSRGVTPQSRRILVKVLCHLELKSNGSLGASSLLSAVFNTSLNVIAGSNMQALDVHTLFDISESAFDLASFSPDIIVTLFVDCDQETNSNVKCLETITSACVRGYLAFAAKVKDEETMLQWNRLRAALFMLLKLLAHSDFPQRACEILRACIFAECDAIQNQCSLGPNSESSIFCETVICSETVPAGLFVKLLAHAVSASTRSNPLSNCMLLIRDCSEKVLACITSSCPDPAENAFLDPRPTLAESWYLLMVALIDGAMVDGAVESILVDTFVAFVSLLFYPSMAKTLEERRRDPGMSLDGPQTLAATIFLEKFFRLGFQPVAMAGRKLACIVPVDWTGLQALNIDPQLYGISIVGAALFRANQGSLPPWAVESIPEVYCSFFYALNKDVAAFAGILRISMEIRLSLTSGKSFGMVQPGSLLSGKVFDGLSETAKTTFITDVRKLCEKDDAASWRRMKAIVKQACGGKKKETDFGQKPPLTRWEFFRV